MTIRFRLYAPDEVRSRMTRELGDAPTYTMSLVPSEDGLKIISADRVEGDNTTQNIDTHIHTSSLFRKLTSLRDQLDDEPDDRYEFQSVLGEGGTGTVFEMVDNNVGRQVAVKVLNEVLSNDDREAFIREGKLAARLEHPNIIPIYNLDVDRKGSIYLTMKKVEGANLMTFMDQDRENRAEFYDELVLIILKICDALNYAHSLGNPHQDIKPENIMVGKYGEVFLIDWGASSHSSDEIQISPVYMSPQQARGIQPTQSDDIYCLGATLFHCLARRYPSKAETIDELWDKKIKGIIDLPDKKEKAEIPEALMAIALKAMAPKPSERYASIDSFAADLKSYQSGFATSAEHASLVKLLSLFIKRRKRELLVTTLILSVLTGMWGYHFSKIRQGEIERLEQADKKVEEGNHHVQSINNTLGSRDKEMLIMSAQSAYRKATFLAPNNDTAQVGLREALLLHFDLALKNRKWGQAEEKLWQALDYGLDLVEYEERLSSLEQARNKRQKEIVARIKYIMSDAGKAVRELAHDRARHELMALKGPKTVDLLTEYLKADTQVHEGVLLNNQIHLAIDALGWLGETRAINAIIPYMQKVAHGRHNPALVQEAAIIALCLLIDDDKDLFGAIQGRLRDEPNYALSELFQRVKPYFTPLAKRFTESEIDEGTSWKNLETKAFALFQAEKHREALETYGTILRSFGENAAIHHYIADCYIALKDHIKAREAIDKALKLTPNDPKVHRKSAMIFISMRRYRDAERAANLAQELAPWEPLSYTTRAVVRRRLADYDAQIEDIKMAIKYGGDKSVYWNKLAEAHSTVNDLQAALTTYSKAIEFNEKSIDSLLGRANTLMKLGRKEEANRDFGRAITLDPKQTSAYFDRSYFKVVSDNLEGALEDTSFALKISPKNVDSLISHSSILKALGRIEEAKSYTDKLSTILKDQNKAVQLVDRYYRQIEANQRIWDLVGKNLNSMDELLLRAKILGQAGRLEEAKVDYELVIKHGKTFSEKGRAYQALVWISERNGDREAQFKYLKGFSELHDPLQRGRRLYSWQLLYCPNKKYRNQQKALEESSKALRIMAKYKVPNKNKKHILVIHARAQYEAGLFSEAVKTQKQIIKLAPQNLDAARYWLERYEKAKRNKP